MKGVLISLICWWEAMHSVNLLYAQSYARCFRCWEVPAWDGERHANTSRQFTALFNIILWEPSGVHYLGPL